MMPTMPPLHFRRVASASEPFTYTRWAPNGADVKAELVCPKHHTGTVRAEHAVDDNGVMTPSYHCPRPGCDFHAWVIFEDWGKA